MFASPAQVSIKPYQPCSSKASNINSGLLALLLGIDAGHLLFYFPPINQLVDAIQSFQSYRVLDKGVA